MDEQFQQDFAQEESLSFSDKLVGVFTDPSNTFSELKKSENSVTNWLIPLVFFILALIAVNLVSMSNPVVNMKIQEKQMQQIEKNFAEMVENGTMSEEQANQQLDMIEGRIAEQMEKGKWIQIPTTILVMTIFFFIIGGFFFLVVRFGLKGEGSFSDALTAYGLPYYIATLQVVIMGLAIVLLEEPMQSLSVAEFVKADNSTLTGLLLSKLDIFSIWFYSVVGIGFAKMFNIESTSKVVITILAIWFGFSFIMFYVAQAFPVLKFFGF